MKRFIPHHTEDYAWFIDFAPHVFYLRFGDLFKYNNPHVPLKQALEEAAQGKTIVLNAADYYYEHRTIVNTVKSNNLDVIVLVPTHSDAVMLSKIINVRYFPHTYIMAIAGNLPESRLTILPENIKDKEFQEMCIRDVEDLIVFHEFF